MPGPLGVQDAPDQTATPQQTPPGSQSANAAPPAAPQTTSPPTPAIATQPMQNAPLPTKDQQSWGDRVYHGVLDALGGSNDVTLSRDPDTGKMVATAVKSGPGQQWKRIIAGALGGFSAAAQTKPGPGYTLRAAGAGVQAGAEQAQQRQQQQRQNANEDFDAELKAKTSQAQNALLTHQIAQSTFELGRAQVEAGVQDLDRENTFAQVISQGGAGSQDLGVFPDFAAVMKSFKDNPELHDHQAGGRLIAIPHIDADGKVDGVHAALVSPDWLNSKIAQDLPITVRDYEKGKLVEKQFTIPAGSLTGDQYSKLVMSQSKDALDEYTTAQKAAQEQERLAQEGSRTVHENAANDATVAHEEAETRELGGEAAGAGAGPGQPGAGTPLVDLVGKGQISNPYILGRISTKNPGLFEEVARKYPGFDQSKIAAYVNNATQFTSGKKGTVGDQLNRGDTAMGHLGQLYDLSSAESMIPKTAANARVTQLRGGLVGELGQFYGEDTIPGQARFEKGLGSALPYYRKAAVIEQAQMFGKKMNSFMQQWKNSFPSDAYATPMPALSPSGMNTWKTFDPAGYDEFMKDQQDLSARHDAAAKLWAPAATPANPGGAAPPQLPAAAVSALKEGINTTFANGQTWTLKNGQPTQVQVPK